MSKQSSSPSATDATARPSGASTLRAFAEDIVLHPRAVTEPPWKLLPWILLLAFVVRAIVALGGDYILRPDEIQQYLEQAHRLVFGYGIRYWEYFYGARSWLVPGLITGMLYVFKLVGLSDPMWYVGGIKLLFCAISLVIPAGMYFFARGHFGEAAARIALLAGALWYELIGFAHKPLTEFVALVPFFLLLTISVRPALTKPRSMYLVALLAVLTGAIRMQYAPLALLMLGLVFARVSWPMKGHLVLGTIAFFLGVGAFDAVTWNSMPFHPYIMNLLMNVETSEARLGESPFYQYAWWLVLASGGLAALCFAASLRRYRHYGLVLALIILTLVLHSIVPHKEYRFLFMAIPLWLLLGAGIVASLKPQRILWIGPLFLAVSLAGILNELPSQREVHRTFALTKDWVYFIRSQDPILEAVRYLSRAPDVHGIVHVHRYHHEMPGYYYLHLKVPFYDLWMYEEIIEPLLEEDGDLARYASHILADRVYSPPKGYRMVKKFGFVRIWQWQGEDIAVREWQDHQPILIGDARKIDAFDLHPNPPIEPENFNVQFVDLDGESAGEGAEESARESTEEPAEEAAQEPAERRAEGSNEP